MSKINYDQTIKVGDLVLTPYAKDKVFRVVTIMPPAPASWNVSIILNPQVNCIEVFDMSPTRTLKAKTRKSKTKDLLKWDISAFTKLDQNAIDKLKSKLDEIVLLLP